MPDCCNGKRQTSNRTHQHGGHTSGRDSCSPDLSPSTTENLNPGKVTGARSRDPLPIRQASNGLQGSQTSIVRAHNRVDAGRVM
ncbi:hypothetical protein SB6419_04970 [Klebsiella spallanzanii]|nr:hypothetical protein SB6419_04970 [Klebsiella spallanzanii]